VTLELTVMVAIKKRRWRSGEVILERESAVKRFAGVVREKPVLLAFLNSRFIRFPVTFDRGGCESIFQTPGLNKGHGGSAFTALSIL